MSTSEVQKNSSTKGASSCSHLIFIALLLFFISGCGGGGGGEGQFIAAETSDGQSGNTQEKTWSKVLVKQLDNNGLTSRFLRAVKGDDSTHLVYFSAGNSSDYQINHLILDEKDHLILEDETAIGINNNKDLALAITPDNIPVLAYQGGQVRDCGQEQESDAMFSLKSGNWQEYTGGTGEVERNPVFTDGLAGANLSMAVDSQGDIHICYQFFYEGCDALNFAYPDLLYSKKDSSDLGAAPLEETVEGNIYNPNGTASAQNSAGTHARILLDNNDQPIIFYAADIDNKKGLRMAKKVNDNWETTWISTGEIGAISCALGPDNNPAVAFYIKSNTSNDDEDLLCYADQNSGWQVQVVDDQNRCGKYCSLTFDPVGNPLIAYYEMETYSGRELKNLRLARFTTSWKSEIVANGSGHGLFNTIWTDKFNRTVISTYSDQDNGVYIFYK
jgi:hypothetical protein